MKGRRSIAAALALALAVCLMAGGARAEKRQYTLAYTDLFDTVVMVNGFAESPEAFQETAEGIYGTLLHYHQLYDIYHEYEGMVNLCTVNRRAGETLAVGPEIMELLELGKEAYGFSGGKTDITMGALLKLWSEYRSEGLLDPENAKLPPEEELREAASHRGFDRVIIDPEKGTVTVTDPALQLDVGAIGKGYALEKVAESLPESFLISVGGSVYASSPKPDGSPWVVGVENPEGEGIVGKIRLEKGSVVTSGDYQRYYTVDGERYHHIIDPDTLYPAKLWRSVTIMGEFAGAGDALSTTLFMMSREEGESVLKEAGAEALWIGADGQLQSTEGMEKYLSR